MGRILTAFLLGIALLLVTPSVLLSADCQFVLGFKTLRDLIGHEIVGECLENQHYNANSDAEQRTTGGLLVWRKADNRTAFTDDYYTWINGPNELQKRLNHQRFAWENDAVPDSMPTPSPTPTPRPAVDPILARAFQVMRGTPNGEKVYKMFLQSGASAMFGPLDGRARWGSSPRRIVINEKYRSESPEAIAYTLIWPTVGLARFQDFGNPKSWNGCIGNISLQHTREAQYWLEKFGANGKQNPTELEQGANSTLARYRDGRLESWVRSSDHYRQYCAQFGEPPPVPTPTPVPPLKLPWNYLEIDLYNLLEDAGYKPGSAMFGLMRNHLTNEYGYLPHSLFLAWLDASGRGIGDATLELWQDFYRAFLLNQEFRGLSISAVRNHLEANTYLGPVLTAFLKASYIGSLDERVRFVARVEDALRVGGILGVDASAGCSIHCLRVKTKLRDYLVGKDLTTINAIPSPWPLY